MPVNQTPFKLVRHIANVFERNATKWLQGPFFLGRFSVGTFKNLYAGPVKIVKGQAKSCQIIQTKKTWKRLGSSDSTKISSLLTLCTSEVGDPNCRTQHDGPRYWRWYLNEAREKTTKPGWRKKTESFLNVTRLGTNISPTQALLKMIFLFPGGICWFPGEYLVIYPNNKVLLDQWFFSDSTSKRSKMENLWLDNLKNKK